MISNVKSFDIEKSTDINVKKLQEMGYEVKLINLSDCKSTKWNPIIESNILRLKSKAEKALKEKKYIKAYKLLAKSKNLKNY
jgi:hypothetical protein